MCYLAIARAHNCSIDDVYEALDRHPIELDRDKFLKRTLAMELMRLDRLEMVFGVITLTSVRPLVSVVQARKVEACLRRSAAALGQAVSSSFFHSEP